jgi:hypothetical protein
MKRSYYLPNCEVKRTNAPIPPSAPKQTKKERVEPLPEQVDTPEQTRSEDEFTHGSTTKEVPNE